MPRRLILTIVLVIVAAIFSAAPAYAQQKGVILSTCDFDKEHEVLGIITYRSSVLDVEKIHTELRKEAKKMGADHVVGIRYYSHAGYLYGSGTAIKLIKD